jgi:hypothetical protein
MSGIGDLFQWERFISPSIIKIFYWLTVAVVVLFGISSLIGALGLMMDKPIAGLLTLIGSLLGIGIGILLARIAAEFVLIVFRINEHLGALRNQAEYGVDQS